MFRSQIEEVIRVCKDQLGPDRLSSPLRTGATASHLACCLAAFCVLERERHDRHPQHLPTQAPAQFSRVIRFLALPSPGAVETSCVTPALKYKLAHCLHPDNGIALAVTLEACDRIALLRRMQDRRTGHYRFRLPEACLPQYCVYLASDAREREQERLRPGKEPRYRPTPDDYLVRYIKFLIWWTMDRNACHVAVALGCFLYGYQPGEIVIWPRRSLTIIIFGASNGGWLSSSNPAFRARTS